MNAGPADLLRLGLPEEFQQRTVCRTYDALTVHIASRFDQICFKLYAAVDRGPQSKHFADLRQLAPTTEEIDQARAWCMTHDPSAAFADQLGQAVAVLGKSTPGGDDGER